MSLPYALLLVVVVIAGFAALHHSAGVLRLTVLLAVLIPYDSSGRLFASPDLPEFAGVHPVTWLILVAGVRALLSRPDDAKAVISRYRFAVAGTVLLIVAGVAWTLRSRGHLPGPLLIDQIVVPLGILLWVRSRFDRDAKETSALPRFLVLIGCGEAVVALIGSAAHIPSVWGIGTDFNRQAATVNGPLALALLLVTCIPLVVAVRSSAARLGAVVLLLGGVLTTQSRSGLVVGVLCAALVIFAGRASVGSRAIVILLVPVVVGLILRSSFVSGVASRFADDLGSAALRSTAADYFWDHLGLWLIAGQGVGSSYTVAQAAGLQSSFESAFYMYVIDFGLVVTVLSFGLLLLQVFWARDWRAGVLNGGVAATLASFALAQGYSSIATETVAGVVIWSAVAFGASPFHVNRAHLDGPMPVDPGHSAAQR